MRMNLAVYTAIEEYDWQLPNPNYSRKDCNKFEELIGKFPKVDDKNFPFGKIFLDGDSVGFCRFHIAKNFDFRSRDVVYCVVGTLKRNEAVRVDPIKLFALPEFAKPMNPPPTMVEVDAALRADGGESGNVLYLLKKCAVSIDGATGEGDLSAVFNFDFMSLLERYDYSQKGSMARNELYQKAEESLSAYADLRRALSQSLVRFPELHKELARYLTDEVSANLRRDLSQQLLHTSEMHQTILGALDATSKEDLELRQVISSHLIKKPEMQHSVVNYLGEGPSAWRQQVANRLMDSAEMRQVLLAYLGGCSSDWRLTLGRKLLEKPELLNELKQRIVNGHLSIRRELSDVLVQTPELLQAFCEYLLQSHGAKIRSVCEFISATDEFKIKAFNTTLKDSNLRKEFIKKCVNSTEYQEVLDEKWDGLDEGLSKKLVLSERGRIIFYSEINESWELRREVLKNIYSDLQVIEIEEAIASIRRRKEMERKRREQKECEKHLKGSQSGNLKRYVLIGISVILLIVLVAIAILKDKSKGENSDSHHSNTNSLQTVVTDAKNDGISNTATKKGDDEQPGGETNNEKAKTSKQKKAKL